MTKPFESYIQPFTSADAALVPVAENIWQIETFFRAGPGITWTRTMTVYKRPDRDGLVIWNAVAMPEEQMKTLEALGTPEIILIPNLGHATDVPAYKQRYPEARILCAACIRDTMAKRFEVAGTVEDEAEKHGLILEVVCPKTGELVMTLDRTDGGQALLFNDILAGANTDSKYSFLARFMLRHLGGIKEERPAVNQLFLGRFGDKGQILDWARRQQEQLAGKNETTLLLFTHGSPVEAPLEEAFRSAWASLLG